MFSQLSDRLDEVFKKLRGLGKLSEANVAEAMREVRIALLEADVDLTVVKAFINAVKDRAMGDEVLKSVTPGQQIVKVFHDSMVELLGSEPAPLNLDPPGYVLLCGLNGAGKTTTCAKLGRLLKKEGQRPALVALDLQRPAAIRQLEVLAGEIGVPIFIPQPGETDVIRTAKAALNWVAVQRPSSVIFDTAGRQEMDDDLISELRRLVEFLNPGEVLLVADSATGQQAVNVATRFHEAIGITGLVLTKLDGDARGGAALSMRAVTLQPIKFIGVGEKLDQLEHFDPSRLAERILGMGDVVGLVEKAAEALEEKDAMHMMDRFSSGEFDFNDFLAQMRFMKRLGPLEGIIGMLPGMGKMKDMKVDDNKLKRTEAIVLSMTVHERRRPEVINFRRRQRIARGSGTQVSDVNQLLDQMKTMRKLFKDKGKMKGLMKMMGGGGFPGMGGGLPPGFGGLTGKGGKMPKMPW
ncbi:MAG: signal recognition particle protein [Verrucomicrobiales bacterium]